MTGSATEIRKGVAVAIGQTVTLDFQLKVSEVATAIEVADVPRDRDETGSVNARLGDSWYSVTAFTPRVSVAGQYGTPPSPNRPGCGQIPLEWCKGDGPMIIRASRVTALLIVSSSRQSIAL